jgi:hypothetical protein
MKAPVRYSSGHIKYTGRVARASFDAWAESPEGQPTIDAIASHIRFAWLGRTLMARRRVWRRLTDVLQSPAIARAMQRQVNGYFAPLESLAYASNLPRIAFDRRRLVVVPRTFVSSAAARRIEAALVATGLFAATAGDESLRSWLVETIVRATESAVASARPSPKRPFRAGKGWMMIGVNDGFEWHAAETGRAWAGHYYLLEVTPVDLTRADRRRIAAAVAGLEASLPSLSRHERGAILNDAWRSVESLLLQPCG